MSGRQQKDHRQAVDARLAEYKDRLTATEQLCGHQFANRELLLLALTHPSAVEKESAFTSYERLEFMGDALMGAFISRYLYEHYPLLDEGALTRLKVSAVAGSTLAKLAEDLGMAALIIFGSSEKGTGQRGLSSALEDAYEALVAALALDGGMEVAERFVLTTLVPLINDGAAREPENPKSALQEVLQARGVTPTYETIAQDGPPHDRVFTAQVLAGTEALAEGTGHSKKDAEMDAASKALDSVRKKPRKKR